MEYFLGIGMVLGYKEIFVQEIDEVTERVKPSPSCDHYYTLFYVVLGFG